jgi:hypothetical protein
VHKGVLPTVFSSVFQLIAEWGYEDVPQYSRIFQLLKEGRERSGVWYQGNEWQWLWELDPEATAHVPRVTGDSKYDAFDPDDDKWNEHEGGGCCRLA